MGPRLASWTRSSGVKSRNRRFGSGGGSIWPGLGCSCGVLTLTSMLDLGSSCARLPVRASHNPPATSSAAIARNRCLAFIVFFYLTQVSHSLSLPHCERISGSWLSIWNEGGEFWCEEPASRNELGSQPSRLTLAIAVRSLPTAASNTQKWASLSKLLKPPAR